MQGYASAFDLNNSYAKNNCCTYAISAFAKISNDIIYMDVHSRYSCALFLLVFCRNEYFYSRRLELRLELRVQYECLAITRKEGKCDCIYFSFLVLFSFFVMLAEIVSKYINLSFANDVECVESFNKFIQYKCIYFNSIGKKLYHSLRNFYINCCKENEGDSKIIKICTYIYIY